MEDAEKAELLNTFFALIITDKTSPQEFTRRLGRRKGGRKTFPWARRTGLESGKPGIHKSMDPADGHQS